MAESKGVEGLDSHAPDGVFRSMEDAPHRSSPSCGQQTYASVWRSSSVPKRLSICLGITLLLLACQLFSGASPSSLSDKYGVDPQETIFLVDGQPRTLDPALTLGGPGGPLGHIFSGLVTLDTDLQVQPDLAAGWTVSPDGLVYTFYLRKNAIFHDGRPVDASDVVFSWERAVNPSTASDTAQTYLGDIVGVSEVLRGDARQISGLRLIDSHTLQVRLTAPVIYFLQKLAYPVTFVVDRNNVEDSGWEYAPNGTGPFSLQVWRDDDVIILDRNEAFYNGPPRIAHLVYNLGPDLPLALYEQDEIDLVGVGGSSLERARDPNDPLSPDLRSGASLCTSVIGLNNQAPPLDDQRVRQAFNYALDKERLVEALARGSALVARGALPPGMPGYSSANRGYPFDPDEARHLLVEAGYANGAALGKLTYSTAGYGDPGPFVTAVITMWQQYLGVTVEPQVIDPFLYYDELYAGRVGDFYSSGWCADYPDPQNFLDVLYHSESRQNIGGFQDAKVDTLLQDARVERDVTRRMQLYADIESLIIQEAPVVFASHDLSAVLVKPRVQGYVLTPIGVPQWHRVTLNR